MKKRVVITGMGTINPLGDNLDDYYNNLIAGKSGIKVWESEDFSNIDCKLGGDIGDYDAKAALEKLKEDGKITEEFFKKLRKLFRTMTFSNKASVICTLNAYMDAGLWGKEIDPYRASVIVAGHNINMTYVMKNVRLFDEEPAYMDPLFGVEGLDPNIPGTLSEVLGIHGPTFTVGAACASGNIAMREGFRDIITGDCDVSVINGAIYDMTAIDVQAMAALTAVVMDPQYESKPKKSSRPFDRDRAGFLPSHGTGTIVLEELEHAKARGAEIYGEVLYVGANANANHLPEPSDEYQAKLMQTVIERAGLKPEDIDYVNCHATSTPVGDIKEVNCIKKVFGKHAYNLKINAPKSMLGHTCWAAAVVETIGGVLQMKHGKLHPSINVDNLDPQIDLDVCKDGPVDHQINIMLKNSFGFGGLNSCSIIKRYED